MIGAVVAERYELRERLGSGGSSSVWRARDRASGHEVALKILDPALAEQPAAVARFAREARALERVQSEHVVRLVATGEDDGRPYTACELIDGPSLRVELRRRVVLPVAEAVAIAEQVAAGLADAHAAGVVHRDLKPSNILITRSGEVKLADFGIARTAGDPRLTQPGRVLGTGEYVSPEQALGRESGPQGDLYALGIVLYEMLAGRPPFRGQDFADVATQHVRADPPALPPSADAPPQALVDLIMACLAKAPGRRPQGAERVRAELQRLLVELPASGDEAPVVTVALADQRHPAAAAAAAPESDTDEHPIPVLLAPAGEPTIIRARVVAVDPERDDEPTGEIRSDAMPSESPGRRPRGHRPPVSHEPSGTYEQSQEFEETTGIGFTRPPSSRRDAGPLRWAAVGTFGAAVAIGLILVVSSGGSSSSSKTAGGTKAVKTSSTATGAGTGFTKTQAAPAAVKLPVTLANSFDPFGDQTERQAQIGRLIDGDPRSYWETETYSGSPTIAKGGVGAEVQLAGEQTVVAVTLWTPKPGFTVSIYTSDAQLAPTALAAWTPGTKPRVITAARTRIGLPKPTKARWVLIWITSLTASDTPGQYTAQIGEVRVLGTPAKA